jgi:hypothetical protein
MEQLEPIIIFALAAFSESASPRLVGITFGIQYDPTDFVLVDSGPCADFELASDGWPSSGAGTALTWDTPQSSTLTELYWFAGYAAYASQPTTFALAPHPLHGANFADDSIPAVLDAATGLGAIGFGLDGIRPCPLGNDGPTDEPSGTDQEPDSYPESGDGQRSEREVLIVGTAARSLELGALGLAASQCGVDPIVLTMEHIRTAWPGYPDTVAIQKEIHQWFQGTNLLEKSVVLFGSWTGNPEYPQWQQVPTRYVYVGDLAPVSSVTASDQPYGDLDLDGLWDVPVWRVVTRNAAETNAFCSKVVAYYNTSPTQEWTRHVEYHCNDLNYPINSQELARELSADLASQIGGNFVNDGLIQSSQHPGEWNEQVLPTALSAGKALIVASPSVASNWMDWLLEFSPIDWQFDQCAANSKWPLMLGASCNLGSFDIYDPSPRGAISRNWFQVTDYRQGPISWISPTSGSYQYVNYWLLESLQSLLTVHGCNFGQALLQATRSVHYLHPEAEEALRAYVGLGVPWLSLHRTTGNPSNVEASSTLGSTALVVVPNPVRMGGAVQIGAAMPNLDEWDGVIVNLSGRVVRRFTCRGTTFPWDLRDNDGKAVASGVYFVRRAGFRTGHANSIVVVR